MTYLLIACALMALAVVGLLAWLVIDDTRQEQSVRKDWR